MLQLQNQCGQSFSPCLAGVFVVQTRLCDLLRGFCCSTLGSGGGRGWSLEKGDRHGNGQWGQAVRMGTGTGSGDRLSAPRQSGTPHDTGHVPVTLNSSLCSTSWAAGFVCPAVHVTGVGADRERELAADFSGSNRANVEQRCQQKNGTFFPKL